MAAITICSDFQFSSVTQSCPTLCNPMNRSTPGFPVLHYLQSLLKFMSMESVMPSNHLILSPPSPPALNLFQHKVFSNELALHIRQPIIRTSASESVFPMNIHGWFPLGLTGFVSLLFKGLSRVFSSTTVWKHQFFRAGLLYGPTLTSTHDYWKNHSFD